MPPAARLGDMMKQDAPHCHAPIHPPAPVPTPLPHPGIPLTIVSNCVMTVMIAKQPAAVLGSMSLPCTIPGCVPAGPGMVQMGSTKVMIGNRPAARVNDITAHPACVAPIPAPIGKIMPPGATTVIIGG